MLFRKFIGFFFFLFSAYFTFGQFVYTKQFTYENGLPSNEILSIYKDSRDYVWVGTRFGVFVKDMDNFKMLKRLESVQFNNVWSIVEDQDSNLWFGSYGQGIVKFTGQNFDVINTSKGLVSNRVRKLFIHQNMMYVATQGGLSIIDLKSYKIYNPSFEKNNNIAFEAVSFFHQKGKVYVSTIDHGVFEVSTSKLKLINSFNRILYNFTYQDKLFLTSDKGLSRFSTNQFIQKKSASAEFELPTIRDHDFSEKRNSVLAAGYDFASGNGMVTEFFGDKVINRTKEFKITSEYPNRIFSNVRNNLIYVGSADKGIFEVHLNHFLDYKSIDNQKVIESLKHQNQYYLLSPLGLYREHGNHIDIVTKRNDFYAFMQKKRGRFSKFLKQKNKDFLDIDFNLKEDDLRFYRMVKNKSSFWVATNLGLFELDLNGKLQDYLPNRIYQFTFFKNQFIQANPFGGVMIFDDIKSLKYSYFSDSQGNIPKDVVAISKNENAVFFGSSLDGLFKYEKGNFTSYLQNNQFKEAKIRMIKCVGNDQLIVATEFSKVYILDVSGNEIKTKKEIDVRKLGGDNISSIDIFDGKILIGTNRNLLVLDKNKVFNVNGEQGFTYKNIHSSFFDGKIVTLGVENGYYKIDLKQLTSQGKKPKKVLVTGLKINDEKVDREKFSWFDLIDKNLELKNNQNNIFIDFSLVNVEFPKNYKYRYRINENENWSDSFNDEFIFFRNLKHGNFHVQLEITDTNNNEKQVVKLISLNIEAPFYLNIYFIFFSILTLGLLIYFFYSNKIKTITKFNQYRISQLNEQNKQEKQRLLLERKLSETRLSALQSQMNPHFIFNVLNSIQFYILDNDIENAINSLGRFSHLIRHMLNLSTKNEISLQEEIDFLKLYVEVENFRWKNKVQFNITSDFDVYSTRIPPMLLQPIIENCFVHAFDPYYENPTIDLIFTLEEHYLRIVIKDNGKGISVDKIQQKKYESKALKIINERLQLLNQNEKENFIIDRLEQGISVTFILRLDF